MTPTTNPISQLHINEEYQDLIPPLTTQEYNALKINIKDNGQRIPIIVSNRTGELVVIDGHHRYKISQELEREPQFEIGYFESETEELEYIRDCNIEGRNLNIVQKVHVILKTEDKLIEIAKKNSHANLKQNQSDTDSQTFVSREPLGRQGVNEKLGKEVGTSHENVRKIKRILKEAPQHIREKAMKGQYPQTKLTNSFKTNRKDKS